MTFEDMDKDLPQVPEDLKELRKFKETNQFKVRTITPSVLEAWLNAWPGQTTYICQQIWFTEKMRATF